MIFDYTYLLIIPAFILTLVAQIMVSTTFNKYSKQQSNLGETGEQFAKRLVEFWGLYNVKVERVPGTLSDHYDPREKVLRLSDSTYSSRSVAALGVVAHEMGHALQDAKGYAPLGLRSLMVPVTNFGSNFAWIIFLAGLFLSSGPLLNVAILLFTFVVVFTLVTLPVEFNASRRAVEMLPKLGMSDGEVLSVKRVLNAAAMTYVAAAFMAIMNLVRMIFLANSRD